MKKLLLAACVSLAVSAANASHISSIGSIDGFDTTFGAGGGIFSGALSSADDNAWLIFDATIGDNLSINIDIDNWFANAVLLQDTTDGVFAVGDSLNITNFNQDRTGEGDDLTILSHIGNLEFNSVGALNWVANYTGQYAIAIGSANESQTFNYNVSLSGNTSSVPEPSGLALLGLGLVGLGMARRKRTV